MVFAIVLNSIGLLTFFLSTLNSIRLLVFFLNTLNSIRFLRFLCSFPWMLDPVQPEHLLVRSGDMVSSEAVAGTRQRREQDSAGDQEIALDLLAR